MEPPTSIHLGNRYERVGSPAAGDLERGQAAWASPSSSRASKRTILLAFGAGVLITALGYHVGGSREAIGERLPGRLGEWVGSGKAVGVGGAVEEGETGARVSVAPVQVMVRRALQRARLVCA